MRFINRKLMIVGFCVVLQACTQVDNYVLGKDNTPKPAALTTLVPKENMHLDWSVPIGQANKSPAYLKLKPVIRGNIIYTADASGMVKALDKRSGQVLWSRQLKHPVVSGPTVAEGCLAIGTNASTLVVLKQSDGQKLWQASVSEDVLSKAAIGHQKIVVKTIDGNLYAFNLKTGEKIWVADHGSPSLILKASSSPVMMSNLVLVGFSDGKLDAVDIDSGRPVWQRSIAYASGSSDVERLVDIDADPIVRDGIVYLASYQGYVGALALTNGQFIWNKPASIYKNMAMDATTLYMTDSHDVLWAMDKQSGLVKWKQVSFKARGLTEPVLMGDHVIVGDKMGYVHVMSTQTGEITARTQLTGAINISPVTSARHVYVMTADGKLNSLSVS